MSGVGPRAGLPLVAVRYGPRCVPVMELVGAAAGRCDLLWLVDRGLEEMVAMQGLLSRYGTVLDVSGTSAAELAQACAAAGVAGVATYLDAGMVELAAAAAELGLPFHSPQSARTLVDKAGQREALASAGIEVPACAVLPAGDAGDALASVPPSMSWPAIVKPRSAQGSHHTFLASDPDHARSLLDSLGEHREEMVLEQYIAGDPARADDAFADYLSVESIVSHGDVSHVALTGRFPLAENFRETGFFVPALLGSDDEQAVLDLASAAIAALEVTDGCLHTEVKLSLGGPRVIEVNGRLGGGVHEMVVRASGVSLLDATLDVALGVPVRIDGPVATQRVGFRFFLQPPPVTAVIKDIAGLDAVTDLPGVDAVSIHQPPGAGLDWRDGSRNHVLSVLGSVADHDELLQLAHRLHEEVTVTYAELPG